MNGSAQTENRSPITDHRSLLRECSGALGAGAIVVAFCLILLWHDPLVFWNDDYQLSILPVFADVARSWNEGHFPLLSPYSWVCNNLAGEFEYGTFSVFINAAVVLIWKFPLTFPQQGAGLSITHLVVLAMGAFLLARDRRLSTPLSIFVALVATLNGWIICWGATDWFGALGAFAWFPWAWWGLERALGVASASSRCSQIHGQDARATTRYRFLWPAPFVYLLVTGGFPYTVVMLLLLIAWLLIKSLVETKSLISILPMLFGAALGFGLSAPAWLAILNYVPGSARHLQMASSHFQWLVPPSALPGFVLPCWTVNWANFSTRYVPHTATELACGLVAPVALIVAFIRHPGIFIRQAKWELILLVFVLFLSMLPSAGLFRWSFRWLPFFHLVLAICAAQALQMLFRERSGRPGPPVPAAAVLLLAVFAVAMSILGTTGPYAFPLTWIFLQLAVMWVVVEFFLRDIRLRAWMPALVTFGALLATYLCIPPNCGVPKFNFAQTLLEPAPLDRQRFYLSIYPPPETEYRVENKPGPVGQTVRPGNTSMWAGLRFINGYSPICPGGVAREFWSAVHGEIDSGMGDSLLKEQAGRDGKLALLGVDGIAIAREVDVDPQPASEWELVTTTYEGRVFHRRGPPFARVRSIAAVDSRTGQQFSTAAISRIDDSRNRVQADVDVPAGERAALLIFSRPYFRGYQARVDDKKLIVESENALIPVVRIPPGTHGRLTLEYRPAWLVLGMVAASLCVAILVVGLVLAARRL